MPGFVNPNETQSRTDFYRGLIEHLDNVVFGEKFDLPHSDSGQYTAALNPVEAFDKSRFPEGAIFSDPDTKWTESSVNKDLTTNLSRVLTSQVADIARASGRKMSSEQSAKAMKKILGLAPNEFSRSVRQDLITELKSSGILEHPSTERVYAVGSAVTGKEVPSDLDIIVRSTPRVNANYRKLIGDIPDDEEMLSRGVHTIWPHGSASSGIGNMSNLRQQDLISEVGDTSYSVATVGQGKYGKDHKWIRLLGVGGTGSVATHEASAATTNEIEDKPSLYKALRGLISGEEFVNPYRFGETSFAQNPKKFIDRSDPNYQESIYAEPTELPSMDSGGVAAITKREAVKMLAKTAQRNFGPLLKKQGPEVLQGSGWEGGEFLSVGNEGIRASVRDVIKEARRTPDYLLDPLKETNFVTIPDENVAGQYFSRGKYRTREGLKDNPHTPRIDIDPALANAKTFRHEIGHSRHLDSPMTEKALATSEPGVGTAATPSDVLRRYMELVTSRVGEQGKQDAAKAGKKFYWRNPREIIARGYAENTGGRLWDVNHPLTTADTEEAYREILTDVFREIVSKAPKYSAKIAQDPKVTEYMTARYGSDWKDFVRLGAKSETKDIPLYKITSDDLNKVGVKSTDFGKRVDTYADMGGRLNSIVRDSVISTPEKSINATHWSKGKIKGDFDFNRLGEVTQGNNPQATESAKLGVWFTESNEAISSSHKVPNKAELALKNPLVLTNENVPEVDVMGSKLKDAKQWLMDEIEKLGGGNKLRDKLKKQGYDGIILDDSEFNNAKSYVVFDKTQMKFID